MRWRHNRFIKWLLESKDTRVNERNYRYLQQLYHIGVKDLIILKKIEKELSRFCMRIYVIHDENTTPSHKRTMALISYVGNIIEEFQEKNDELYDQREEALKERYYENDGP